MNAPAASTIYTETLPCGLRLIVAPSEGDVAYCGIAINAGTRDENEQESGIAHFCEHLTFKGTVRRRAWHILNRMDTVGGDINAFTGKEDTVFYTTFLKEHYSRAIDLLVDIVFGSTYPQVEMNKEVEVVIDEIESYNDSPSELIFDDFEHLIFRGHSLGRNILGRAEILKTMTTSDVRHYTDRCYRPENMVLFFYGKVPVSKVCREVNKALSKMIVALEGDVLRQLRLSVANFPAFLTNKELGRKEVSEYYPQEVKLRKNTHQAHVMIGSRSYSAYNPKHTALYLLNNMIGGPGMNSRLNLCLRERKGLVYTVESNVTAYSDTGVWSIYFGCDPSDVNRCRRLIQNELDRFVETPLSNRELEVAKRQIKGQIGISSDQKEGMAIALGKSFLHYNKIRDLNGLYKKIDALTSEDLQNVAKELFPKEKLTTLIYH